MGADIVAFSAHAQKGAVLNLNAMPIVIIYVVLSKFAIKNLKIKIRLFLKKIFKIDL